jgi:hypothetical protein
MSNDIVNWSCTWGVQKYDEDAVAWLTQKLGRTPIGRDFQAARVDPYEHNIIPKNLLTTAGLTRITSLITGAGGQAMTAAATRIGVGDNSVASTAAVGDTNLGAATNKYFQVLDGTPSLSAGQMTFVATFTSANGNFLWSEFGIDVTAAATSGSTVNTPLINRKTAIAQGTKTSGQSWTASATITLA